MPLVSSGFDTFVYKQLSYNTQYMLLLTEFCVRQQKEARSKYFEGDLFDYWHEVHIAGNKTNKKYSKLYYIMVLIILENHYSNTALVNT